MKRYVLGTLGLVLACHAAVAVPPQEKAEEHPRKPAWQWTVDERLAARFDPEAIEARIAREKARVSSFPDSGLPEDALFEVPPSDLSVHGSTNPELFLPHELFDHLIHSCFPADGRGQTASRRMVERRAAALGLGSDLWQRLGASASPLLEYDREHYRRFREAQRAGQAMEEDKGATRRCRLRASAMKAARKNLGEEMFLRLLYEAVAPNLGLGDRPDKNLESLLRYQEGGCQ